MRSTRKVRKRSLSDLAAYLSVLVLLDTCNFVGHGCEIFGELEVFRTKSCILSEKNS